MLKVSILAIYSPLEQYLYSWKDTLSTDDLIRDECPCGGLMTRSIVQRRVEL